MNELKVLDKYILKKFLFTFFFMLGLIMFLAMVFDLSEKLSDFINKQAPPSAIIWDYYFNFLLHYGNTFSSMITFVAVIWFTAKMAQDSEIIPILNSGKPFERFLYPYFIGATILTILSYSLNNWILPHANKKRLQFEEKYYRDELNVQNYHAEYPSGQVVYFSNFYSEEDVLHDFVSEQWDKDTLSTFLKCARATNVPGTKRWILQDGYIRKPQQKKDALREFHQIDTVFQFDMSEMTSRDNIAETMTNEELKKFIEREKKKGSGKIPIYEIAYYQRLSYPFASYVLTIIGVSVSSTKKRGGIGVNIAIGLAIIFIYIFSMKVTTVAAMNVGFPASIAVWVPNILFGGIAYFLYRAAQK